MAPVTGLRERPDFADAWRLLEPEVRRSLRSAPPDVVEDVVQEAGIKLLRAWPTIDHARPVAPLAVTIARNCLRDELRRLARHAEVGLPEELETRDDLVAQVSARLELARVRSVLPRLTPGQREALLREVGGRPPGPDSPRVKMLKARARVKLRELLASAGGFVATRAARLRSASGNGLSCIASEAGVLLQAAVLAAILGTAGGAIPSPAAERPVEASVVTRRFAPPAQVAGHGPRPGGSAGVPAPRPGAFPVAGASPPAPRPGGRDDRPGVIPQVHAPSSKGRASDGGTFGPEGYDFAGAGSSNAAGHEVGWRYEQRWESPECVQRLAEGRPPGPCAAPSTPAGYVEVAVDGERRRIDLPGGRRGPRR